MAVAMEAVLNRITELAGDVLKIQKSVGDMGRSRAAREDAVVKTMLDARGKAWVPHRGGGGGMDATSGLDWKRCKSAGEGFGEWLQDMAVVAAPNMFGGRDMGAIQKRLASHVVPVQKAALAEGSGYTGGYTVPLQYSNELIQLAAEESFLFKLCKNIPMNAREIRIPVLDQTQTPPTNGSAYFGGLVWQWQPESSDLQANAETEPKFRQVQLVARDLVGIVVATNQLIQDSPLALDTILTSLFKQAMAWAYDYFILRGSGSNQPLGLLTGDAKISVTRSVSGHFNLIDGANMLAQLTPGSYKNAIWVVHPSAVPDLVTMTNGATNAPFLVWLNPVQSNGVAGPAASEVPATFLGRPLYITEKVPKLAAGSSGSVALIDPQQYLVGDRMAIQIESSPYPLFAKNQMMYRIIARWDGQPEQKGVITLADGSYQVAGTVLLAA